MDADQVEASNYTEVFESVLPYYLAVGMSYEQFWEGDPSIVISYRRADEIRKRRMNEELWWGGMYTADALASTVGNMFSKGSKHEYPAEPKPITIQELEERKEREEKARVEALKARFTARALNLNAQMGVRK